MTAPALLALSLLATAPLQELAPPRFEAARPALVVIVAPAGAPDPGPTAPPTAPPSPRPTQGEERAAGLTWVQLAHRLGGALVGGWLGYVGAQVARSDWDKETNQSFQDQRYSWAAAGAVVGVLGSHLFRSGPPARPGGGVEAAPRDRSYIGLEEIRRSEARTAFELVYYTRMHWLTTRGVNSPAESPRGEAYGDFIITVTPGREKIIVYLDGVRLGGVESMREVSTDVLTSARFFGAREATLRYGGGHAHGAILLSTAISR